MANSIHFSKSKPSKLRRLAFLPRFGIYIDFAGIEFSFRQAPLTETIFNTLKRNLSLKELMSVALDQLSEINFPGVEPVRAESFQIVPEKLS